MSWDDLSTIVNKKTTTNEKPLDEVSDKVDLPIVQYFPTYEAGGEIIQEKDISLELNDDQLTMYEDMVFDEGRGQAGQLVGSVLSTLTTAKKSASVLGDTFNIRGKDVKNLIPKPARVVANVGLQLVSAWTGGTVGDLAQSSAQGDLNKNTWSTALNSAFDAGNEEAFYELLGHGVTGALVKTARFVAGKPYMNIQFIKDKIAESGGKLTASQIVDGTILDTVEGLVEVSWGGRHIREQRVLNDEAINRYVNEFQISFLEGAEKTLSDVEYGRLYQKTIQAAQNQHKAIGGQMFEHLDEVIAGSKLKVYDGTGSAMINATIKVNPADLTKGMVSSTSLKNHAKFKLKQIEGVAGAIDSWEYKYYTKIIKNADEGGINKFINFGEAQKLRSALLEQSRNFADKTHASFSASDLGAAKQLIKLIDQQMGDAALRVGDDFYQEFRAANKFWKTGQNRLNNKLITGIIKQNPERVGAKIFATGNVAEIRQARQALKSAEFFTKGTDDAFNFNKTWQTMQQGYLVNLVSKSRNVASTELTQGTAQNFGKDIAGGELDITALKKLFTDPEKMRTFKTAFTKGQRVEIKNLMQAVEFAQRRPLGAGTFMVTVGQAGLVMAGLVGGVGYAAGGAVGAIASLTITPAMIGHILTNPKMTSLLAKGLHMKPGNPKYAATLAKLANFVGLTPTVEETF
mgnify:FL=1